MKQAQYTQHTGATEIRCLLCPHQCKIENGKAGICRVRRNVDGLLVTDNYQCISALHLDPIEKKPLYHFYPGKQILSIGSIGCNLRCTFCQNCEISQAEVNGCLGMKKHSAEEVVDMAAKLHNNIGIAFTYNEPVVFYEFMMDIAELAIPAGLKTVMVSNGFINPEPLNELTRCIDAFNIDLKAFRDEFYRKQTGARLDPVLTTLKAIKAAGKHLEITNLIIPGLNDDRIVFREMITWISEVLGRDTVLHLSRYFPHHKLKLDATPVDTLLEFYSLAMSKLDYVYLGNVDIRLGNMTRCAVCDELLIKRHGYTTSMQGLTNDMRCIKCGETIQNIVI